MIYQLSREEVLKVCGGCPSYLKGSDCCRAVGEPKPLAQTHKCAKWDQAYGGQCLFRG